MYSYSFLLKKKKKKGRVFASQPLIFVLFLNKQNLHIWFTWDDNENFQLLEKVK